MALPDLSIRRPVATAMACLAAVLLGVIAFTRLPVNLLPDVALPTLAIWTEDPEAGPAEVERFVTEPIENAVARVPSVKAVSSTSREGGSVVRLQFVWGTDMDYATLNVREKLDNVGYDLPERAGRPTILRSDPTSDPILTLAAVSDSAGLWELKELAENVFKRRLEQIDGIAQAVVAGGLEREIHVAVDPARLEALGVTLDDVSSALAAANVSAPGGTIRRGRYRYALRALGEFQTVDEIGDTPVDRGAGRGTDGSAGGAQVRLRDVAAIQDAFADRETIARYDGRESVGLLLYKEAGANTVRAASRVRDVLEQLRQEYPAVELTVASSQAGFIRDAISNVVQALALGAVLAFLVLFLFLHDARYPVAISLSIPISVVLTFGLLYAFGVSLNIMSLGGLALGVGMLVDNSIVVLENIFRHREQGLGMREAATRGAREVQGAITASTLTTIAVFGPIIYVKGVAGELFGDLSIAVATSLLISLAVALTLLPMMASRMGAGAGADDDIEGGGVARDESGRRSGLRDVFRGAPVWRWPAALARWLVRLATRSIRTTLSFLGALLRFWGG
ncbi:MAG TPA: efflux RND transporter permease subunit, partial [Actinomycetota bacterium]|nr:efflux RND transporter permease subunit [Actinomycetota bacterium]